MQPQQWQQAWKRTYNNVSDQRWKTKSLNPNPLEPYLIPIPKTAPKQAALPASTPKKDAKEVSAKTQTGSDQDPMLPSPRMNKINDTMFCMSMEQDVHLFYQITNPEEKAKMKLKRTFGIASYQVGSKIKFVRGSNSDPTSKLIFVGTDSQLIVLQANPGNPGQEAISKKFSKPIQDLKLVITLGKHIIALSGTSIIELDLLDSLKEIAAMNIEFNSKQHEMYYAGLNPVGLVVGSGQCLYYFGSRIQEKLNISKLKGAPGQNQSLSKSQALTLVRLEISGNRQIDSIKGYVYPIDYIFELGMFTLTKIYEIQHDTFLLSLHQEVILIKKNFEGYVVWDNVSVQASKSQSKKGQLILADKTILIYSQNADIFAHQVFFDDEQAKLSMPQIDSFRGNDNDQQILYDSILLFWDDSIIKVLAYIKPSTVVYQSNKDNRKRIQTDPSKAKDEPTDLQFTIICINQSDPLKKLEQLFSKGKSSQQIDAFCARFDVSNTNKIISQWNVSQKKLKDIENILMEIPKDDFIRTELDNILKKQSHGLDFLIAVQNKQISRLKRQLSSKIRQYAQLTQQGTKKEKLLEYVYQIVQWLMESFMFSKKLQYSKKFLSFKEYDFIQIGKLKAASLKEEIKLLSCKKYEKRLKYFLNSFKILVIANYEQVFKFLLIGKNEKEIQEFIKQFKFILPNFQEPSQVFIQQVKWDIIQRNRTLKFNAANLDLKPLANTPRHAQSKHVQKEQKCQLWQPLDQNKEIEETMEIFEKRRISDILNDLTASGASSPQLEEKAVKVTKQIFKNFQESAWFKAAAFKQHSMLSKTTKDIHSEFKQLRRKQAFKILAKFLFQKIEKHPEDTSIQNDVDNMLENFISYNLIPRSFKRNVDARVKVYRNVLRKMLQKTGRKMQALDLPILSDFVVYGQPQYFNYLFQNARGTILTTVKEIYDKIQGGFFKQRFQLYLQSPLLKPADIIDFLDEFTEDVVANQIRIQVFFTIRRLLRLMDKVNTKKYIEKSMDKQVLPQGDRGDMGKLRQQAKIPLGFYFYQLFKAFDIDYSYEELINFTNTSIIEQAKVIGELIRRYCKGQYAVSQDYQGNPVCTIHFEQVGNQEEIQQVDIHNQSLQFFGLLLMLLEQLDFHVQGKDAFELMMESYLNQQKFTQLSDFLIKLKQYHMTQANLRTNNYKTISEFKQQIDLDHHFMQYVLNWIKRKYQAINSLQSLQANLQAIDLALNMLSTFNKQSLQVKKQLALLELLCTIKLFDAQLVINVEAIRLEMIRHSSFVFMMHIFKKIGVTKFTACSQSDAVQRFFIIFQAHKQYTLQKKVDYQDSQYIRALIEILFVMIDNNQFSMAKHMMLTKIPNDKYYFKDALLIFLAAADRPASQAQAYKDDIAKLILAPETTKLIRENFASILQKYGLNSFIPIPKPKQPVKKEATQSNQKEVKIVNQQEQRSQYFIRCCEMFDLIMKKNRRDDAFFFLVRARVVQNKAIQGNARKHKTARVDDYQRKRQQQQLASYFLVTSYTKALQMFVQIGFYPTYTFFQSKMILLGDPRQRKDMVKDINIALSKLQRIKTDLPTLQEKARVQLQRYYNRYMEQVGQNPQIKLAAQQGIANAEVGVYARKEARKDYLQQQNQQEIQYKKQLQRNLDRVNQVQSENRLNVLNREVTEKITQIRKANERHVQLVQETKREDKQDNFAQRKAKEIELIKQKQRQEIQSIKDSYKSNTTKRVNDLIQTLRKKRQAIQNKRGAPVAPMKDQPVMPIGRPRMEISAPKIEDNTYLPVTMKAKFDKIKEIKEQVRKGEGLTKLVDLEKKMFPEPVMEIGSLRKKINIQDILNRYRQQQSAEAVKCIQKYDMLKNVQVRMQLVKRAYSVTNHIENYLQFLKFLLGYDDQWKNSIEQKSIGIAAQMSKMQQGKDKINLKEIIPAQFFTNISKTTLKDYYTIAFEMFRPSLKNIFEKELMAVHAVGILFRYTLGSQNRFYNKVFYEYFKVLLKKYETKAMDDKEVTLLVEKIRSNYNSLPESKDQTLEELLNGIGNLAKRKRLLEALKHTIERKGETLVGGQSNKEIEQVVKKMLK